MSGFIHDEHILHGHEPSAKHLVALLLDLASGNVDVNIVIDGLDECANAEIKKVLGLVHQLVNATNGQRCKVLLFSRNVKIIEANAKSKKWPAIALQEERPAIDAAIHLWVHAQLERLHEDREDLSITTDHMKGIEVAITAKADGA